MSEQETANGHTAHGHAGNGHSNGNGNGHGSAAEAPAENLEKVRELLFGGQIRHQDQRFGEFQSAMAKELAEHREDTRKRLESLERFVKAEVGTLVEKVLAETTERSAAVERLGREVQEAVAQLDRRLVSADQQAGEAQRKLREELLAQSQTLRDELDAKQHEIRAIVDRAVRELGSSKTDRNALGDMFGQLATMLKAEAGVSENNRMAAFH